MSPPHQKNGNGNGVADLDEERVIQRARAEIQNFASVADLAAASYERGEIRAFYSQRYGTIVVETKGIVLRLVEAHADSDAKSDAQFERLAGSMATSIVALREEFAGLREEVAAVLSRFAVIATEHEEMKKLGPDDSIVDVLESLPGEVAARVLESSAKKNVVISQQSAEIEDLARQVATFAREKHEAEIREEGRREEAAAQEKAAEKKKREDKEAEDRLKRRMGIIIAAFTLVAMISAGIVAAWTFAAKHPLPADLAPPALTK